MFAILDLGEVNFLYAVSFKRSLKQRFLMYAVLSAWFHKSSVSLSFFFQLVLVFLFFCTVLVHRVWGRKFVPSFVNKS